MDTHPTSIDTSYNIFLLIHLSTKTIKRYI